MKPKKSNVAPTVVMSSPEASIVLPNGILKGIKNEITVGRKDFEEIISPEIADKISSKHLRIWCADGEYFIEDGYRGKPSTNGTFLNDKQIKGQGPQKLKDGDVVKLVSKVNIIIKMPRESSKTLIVERPVSSKTVVAEKPVALKTTVLMPTLTLFWDDRKHTWKVTDELIIGKDDLHNLLLEDKRNLISTKHCRIFKEGSKFYIEDGCKGKPSSNGTTLCGEEIMNKGKQLIKEKDEIVLAGIVKLEVKKIGMEAMN